MKTYSTKILHSATFGIDPKIPIPQPLVVPKEKTPQNLKDGRLRGFFKWWPDQESNQGHKDFQSSALPTELSGQI